MTTTTAISDTGSMVELAELEDIRKQQKLAHQPSQKTHEYADELVFPNSTKLFMATHTVSAAIHSPSYNDDETPVMSTDVDSVMTFLTDNIEDIDEETKKAIAQALIDVFKLIKLTHQQLEACLLNIQNLILANRKEQMEAQQKVQEDHEAKLAEAEKAKGWMKALSWIGGIASILVGVAMIVGSKGSLTGPGLMMIMMGLASLPVFEKDDNGKIKFTGNGETGAMGLATEGLVKWMVEELNMNPTAAAIVASLIIIAATLVLTFGAGWVQAKAAAAIQAARAARAGAQAGHMALHAGNMGIQAGNGGIQAINAGAQAGNVSIQAAVMAARTSHTVLSTAATRAIWLANLLETLSRALEGLGTMYIAKINHEAEDLRIENTELDVDIRLLTIEFEKKIDILHSMIEGHTMTHESAARLLSEELKSGTFPSRLNA